MFEAVAGLIAIILFILKFYIGERSHAEHGNEKDTYEGDVLDMDKAIAKGDADTISALFDRMRIPTDKNNSSGQNDKTP